MNRQVEIVEFLLAHPKMNDPRVDVNLGDHSGNTPLLRGLRSLKVTKLMIAGGREFDWKNERRGEEDEGEGDLYPIRTARYLGNPEVVSLLERFTAALQGHLW